VTNASCLIVGLGNPGPEYEGTRHNVGFQVLDRLGDAWRLAWRRQRGVAWYTRRDWGDDAIVLLKPLTYMNRSGDAVRAFRRQFEVPPERVWVVLDDFALPIGAIRIRGSGSAGGHHGLESVRQALGTDAFPRCRVGIGSSGRHDAVTHVLGRFRKAERSAVDEAVARAVEALECWVETGDLQRCMSRFNGPSASERDE